MEENKMSDIGFDFKEDEQEVVNANDFSDADSKILNEGKSTEAETVVSTYAKAILWWGNLLSIIVAILFPISGLVTIVIQASSDMGDGAGLAFITFIGSIIYAVIAFFLIRFMAKLIWAVIMLFVNISTTLKRIEIQLEKNGTN